MRRGTDQMAYRSKQAAGAPATAEPNSKFGKKWWEVASRSLRMSKMQAMPELECECRDEAWIARLTRGSR
jgi:hypothetical protein